MESIKFMDYFIHLIAFVFHLISQFTVDAKDFKACEIVQQFEESKISRELYPEWLCLSEKLSQRNSSAIRRVPTFSISDPCHQLTLGLFQISNAWCTDENQDHREFSSGVPSCTRNGCQLDCFKLLDDDITDDIECLKTIHELHGSGMWSQTLLNNCRAALNDTTWNETACVITDGLHRKQLGKIHVPLWAVFLIVALSSVVVFGLTYFFYRHRQNNAYVLTNAEIMEFKYGRVSTRPLSQMRRLGEVVQDNFVNESSYNNAYEVEQTDFDIDHGSMLGSGAQGIVYKAMCKGKLVAVKALNPHSTKEYLQSLLGEIKILSHIGTHNHIVNMEGAYTKDIRKGVVYVFMEYCALGNLEKFLRLNRETYVCSLDENGEVKKAGLKSEMEQDLALKENGNSSSSAESAITLKHLLQYSHQIAKGMEFLSSRKIVHGDLASRNVLLVDENHAKISDFGLSRKLYGYLNYIKKKEEPLPWRWMALESLRDMNFSTHSDVWMYGVLLSEIFSLGEVPYPGLSWSLEFVAKLETGFRMLRPKHAPVNVYKEIMLQCWEISPNQRPSFSELSSYFHRALEEITADEYTVLQDPN